MKNASVEITVTIDGQTETFTATGDTSGAVDHTARGLINDAARDACEWATDVALQARPRVAFRGGRW